MRRALFVSCACNVFGNKLKDWSWYNVVQYIMSNDSLVLKVMEVNNVGSEVHRLYIFYDHNMKTFGLRGGYNTRKLDDTMTHSYSYYTDSSQGVAAMLNLISAHYVKLSMCLVRFADLPPTSDEISYDKLAGSDLRTNEIVGFDYVDSQKPMDDIEKFLAVLVHVYNDY